MDGDERNLKIHWTIMNPNYWMHDPTCLYEQIVIFHQHTRGKKPIRAPVNLQFRALLATFEQRWSTTTPIKLALPAILRLTSSPLNRWPPAWAWSQSFFTWVTISHVKFHPYTRASVWAFICAVQGWAYLQTFGKSVAHWLNH